MIKSELKTASNLLFLTFRSTRNPQKNYNTTKYIKQGDVDYAIIANGSVKHWQDCKGDRRYVLDVFCIDADTKTIVPKYYMHGLGIALTICREKSLDLVIIISEVFRYNETEIKRSAKKYGKVQGVTIHLYFPNKKEAVL